MTVLFVQYIKVITDYFWPKMGDIHYLTMISSDDNVIYNQLIESLENSIKRSHQRRYIYEKSQKNHLPGRLQ